MTDTYGPFDGFPWAESEWYDFAPVWSPDGVIGSPAGSATTGGLAFANTGLSVSAGAGMAWVHGAGFERSGTPPTHLVTQNGHASWSRRDRLVLRRDVANQTVETAVKAGTAAASPTAPALTQVEGGVWEMPLFSFLVPPNNGSTISGVVDERVWLSSGVVGPRGYLTRAAPAGAAGGSGAYATLSQTSTVSVGTGRRLEHRVQETFYAAANVQIVTVRIRRYNSDGSGGTTITSRDVGVGGSQPNDSSVADLYADETPSAGSYYWRVEAATNVSSGSAAYIAAATTVHTVKDIGTA